MPGRCPHGERPDLPVARHLDERAAARGVAGPAPRHHLAGRRGRMANLQDPAGQLPALVLGRPLHHVDDGTDHDGCRSPVRPSGRADHHAAGGPVDPPDTYADPPQTPSRSGTSGSPILRTTWTTASGPGSSAATTRTCRSTRTATSGRCGPTPGTVARLGRRLAGTRPASSPTRGPIATRSTPTRTGSSTPARRTRCSTSRRAR